MNKKKMVLLLTAICLLVVVAVSGAYSFMVANTDTDHNVSASNVNIELIEPSKTENKTVPGGRVAYPVKVKNTGDYPCYIRIEVKKYWSNNGEKNYNKDASLIELLSKDTKNWIMDDQSDAKNAESIIFYTRKPIAAHATTTNFLDQVQISEEIDQELRAMQFNIDCSADAIQDVDAKDAMMAEWGLDVDVARDGTLTRVEE